MNRSRPIFQPIKQLRLPLMVRTNQTKQCKWKSKKINGLHDDMETNNVQLDDCEQEALFEQTRFENLSHYFGPHRLLPPKASNGSSTAARHEVPVSTPLSPMSSTTTNQQPFSPTGTNPLPIPLVYWPLRLLRRLRKLYITPSSSSSSHPKTFTKRFSVSLQAA
ncbi:hypothetical protein IEQ34_019053 [Dendrobium chrysotoxum]|uniref:Uncharacterized protein n=1 Tax=Dendrobium chrysotoxum TaxID=161865 RepID=A0AAV7FQ49_DENCH|nr:hypothetical protein IEQ34_019053 [Dendrobium chrysotoxum]